MSETTLQKVEAEVQKLTAELQSVEQAQVVVCLFFCDLLKIYRVQRLTPTLLDAVIRVGSN